MTERRQLLTGGQPPYPPRRPTHFDPARIVLTKGSLADEDRRQLVDRIWALYPDADVIEQLDLPHNRIDLGRDFLEAHYRGKQTLVFGEHRSAVRFSEEADNGCPNYWHFSPYGFCPYNCAYCYLAAATGVYFSPTVKIFLNLPEILDRIHRTATSIGQPTAFYLGKLQDGLALDPLTGYSKRMVPFFARHPHARMTLLTKSADVANLLPLDHGGHTILSWSLNPPAVCRRFESNSPPPDQRIDAMAACAAAGYPVRAVLMPIIPIPGWRDTYAAFLTELLRRVSLDRITLGCICSYPRAVQLMERKLGPDNAVSRELRSAAGRSPDGRSRYPITRRIDIYRHVIGIIRAARPDLPVALCLEEPHVFEALNLHASPARCNCVL